MNTKRRFITALIDRSGSMCSIATDVNGGWAAFLDTQREAAEAVSDPNTQVKTQVMLAQFDDVFEVVYGPVPLKKAPAYTLKARGWTALYDGILKTVEAMRHNIAEWKAEGKEPEDVTLVIMTDGHENASKATTRAQVKALLEEVQAMGWTVLFLAANQDAVLTGQSMGIRADNALSYDAANSSGLVLANVGASMLKSYVANTSVSFTKDDRDAVQ